MQYNLYTRLRTFIYRPKRRESVILALTGNQAHYSPKIPATGGGFWILNYISVCCFRSHYLIALFLYLFRYSSPIIAAAKSFTASSTPRQFPLHRLRFVFLRFLSSGSSLIVRLLDMPPRSAPPSSPPPAAKRRKLSSPSVSLCLVLPLFYVSYPFLFISVLGPRRLFCASVATKY